MPLTLEQTASEALSLPEKERAKLAHVLLSSLEPEDSNVAAEWDTELARRVDEIDRGVAPGRPAADLVRDIRARYE